MFIYSYWIIFNYIKNIWVEKMDLIGGYLLIILLLFSANITLLVGNYKINTKNEAYNISLGSTITVILISGGN